MTSASFVIAVFVAGLYETLIQKPDSRVEEKENVAQSFCVALLCWQCVLR